MVKENGILFEKIDKIDKIRADFVHKKHGNVCGRIRKVIDDSGYVRYECTGCAKEWQTPETAKPI